MQGECHGMDHVGKPLGSFLIPVHPQGDVKSDTALLELMCLDVIPQKMFHIFCIFVVL